MDMMQARHEGVVNHAKKQQENKVEQLKERMVKLQEDVFAEKEKWQTRYNNLETQLSAAKDRVYLEKAKQRTLVQKQIQETERVEMMLTNYAAAVEEENQELRRELKAAIADKQAAERLSAKDKQLAKDRLEKWHTERHLQQKAAKEADRIVKSYEALIEQSAENKRKLRKEWADEVAAHKRGGAQRWPIWVVQLICELLVNGTAPSAIPTNIQTMYETLYGETPEELPSVNFVRECRVVVEVVGETIAALKLAAAENWKQLWMDATTRRQIPFTALVIGLLGDEDNIDPVVISSCIFMDDEKAVTQGDGILSKIDSLKHRLQRLASVVEEKCPEKLDNLPSPDGIDIGKLGDGGVVMTDTCNAAQKLRRILVSIADGV
jgi:hypothetical protein